MKPGPPDARINGVVHAYDNWGSLRTRCGLTFQWLRDPVWASNSADPVDVDDIDCMACLSIGHPR